MLFYATPFNAEIAERLVHDGFKELREAVNNPDEEKHLIVNYLTNTFFIADNEAVEDTAEVVKVKYDQTLCRVSNYDLFAWKQQAM